MKKYLPYLFIILLVVGAIYFNWLTNGGMALKEDVPNSDSSDIDKQVEESMIQTQWETKTDNQSEVVVSVTPLELGQEAKAWQFEVSIDTHSGSLDENLAQAFVLSDDQGNIYSAVSWEGPGPGGHHRAGKLMFRAVDPRPAEINLIAKKVGGVPERSFQWSLN